jgi:alpha-glucosidase (family GH31 glycosyl hydrolase)
MRLITLAALETVALLGCSGNGSADVGPEADAEVEDRVDADGPEAGDDVDGGETGADGGPAGPWTLEAEGIRVEISGRPYGYVVSGAAGGPVLATRPGGAGDGWGAVAWTGGTLAWGIEVSPGYAAFEATLEPWRDAFEVVEAVEGAGEVELVLAPSGGGPRVRIRHAVRASALRVEATVDEGTPRAWAGAFVSPGDEGFLGFGERFTRTEFRGLDVYSWAEEGGIGTGEGDPPGAGNPAPNGEPMTYYPVPFFVSTRGYGFWLDSTWRNEFNLATAHPDAWRVWHIGPALAYEVYLPLPGDPRPWPYQLIDLFTATVGRAMIPPAWTFGPRRRIGRGDVQGGVPEIQAMRDLDLAITGVDDAVHFLPRGSHVGKEEELRAWTASARALGYRVNAYYNPYLALGDDNPLHAELERGLANDWFVRNADGSPSQVWMVSGGMVNVHMVDFTAPAAVEWYQSMLQWALDLGYSGWMYDFGEYVQPGTLLADGTTGEQHHNLYPVLYQRAAFEFLERGPLAGDWLTFVRSGYTGAWRWAPHVWSGDPAASFEESDGLPSMIRAGVNLGVSGAPHWGGDINGFHCVADGYAAADEELLVRWIQQGAMGSNMQDQDACAAALDTGRKANIFDDPLAQRAWRTWARLHTRLFPYLFTLAHEAHATGAPTMRHVFLEHPDRADLAGEDGAYYLGPALYVAPVVHRGETTRTVRLPAGRYVDWEAQQLVTGGATVTLDAPLERLPLLLRDGRLVPLLDPTIDTLAEEDDPDVVGPADVADVYDVVGLVSTAAGEARFALWDGGVLDATWTGAFAAPAGHAAAASEDDLSTCDRCWRRDDLGGGLARARITTRDATVAAGGLALAATDVGRRIRWDLYLVE